MREPTGYSGYRGDGSRGDVSRGDVSRSDLDIQAERTEPDQRLPGQIEEDEPSQGNQFRDIVQDQSKKLAVNEMRRKR